MRGKPLFGLSPNASLLLAAHPYRKFMGVPPVGFNKGEAFLVACNDIIFRYKNNITNFKQVPSKSEDREYALYLIMRRVSLVPAKPYNNFLLSLAIVVF